MSNPHLSIIIPAYNEEKRLPESLEKVAAFIKQQPYAVEVIVVENGSTDRTFELAQGFAQHIQNLHVIHEEQRGKGLAVKRGMLAATGAYRIFCDSDFSMPVGEINRFIPPALETVEISIGSREAPGAQRFNEPAYRHFVGRIFNTLVRWMALPGLQDSQCGFKCFRADVAEAVFPYQTFGGWSFDAEVLFIALRHGYHVQEVPIQWYFNANTRLSVWKDSLRMAVDLFNIRRNARRGIYDA